MALNSTIRPLLLRHALPHIPVHGFTQSALSLSSLSLPPPYQLSAALNPTSIDALFGRGREAEQALVREWLEEKRRELRSLVKGKGRDVGLREVLEARLEMNEEVRPHLAEGLALISFTDTRIPLLNVPIKNHLPVLNHSLHVADDAILLSTRSRPDIHESIPLSLVYLSAELHQLSLPLSQPSMPSTRAYLARRLEEYDSLQSSVGTSVHFARTAYNAVSGAIRSRGVF